MPFPLKDLTKKDRRVVVTGAGILTSLGAGWEVNAAALREGGSGLREISLFDVSGQRTQVGGELQMPVELPENGLTSRQRERLDRASTMLIHATEKALDQAGWSEGADREAAAMVLGTSAGAMSLGESYYRQAVARPVRRRGLATQIHHYLPQRQAALLGDAFGIRGPVAMISNACASGANAIGHGIEMVRSGQADRVVAGGYDALAQLVFAGFDSLQALSTTLPRPFDAERDGLALGEGVGVVILESMEAAREGGATILAEAAGYGAANDSHHLTQPHPEGDAALASMMLACEDAGVDPEEVGYINAHGTGTALNDSAEAAAIARWAGEKAGGVAVSSTKGSTGHTLGGAGAVEAVISLMVLREGWLPPVANFRKADEAVTFDLVSEPRDAEVDVVLSNSFGFGGANATLVFRKVEG